MAGGPAPFYALQDLHAAQQDPVQYDQQPVPGMATGDIDAQYAAAANAWQQAAAQGQPAAAPQAPPQAPPAFNPMNPGMNPSAAAPMAPAPNPTPTVAPPGATSAIVPNLQARLEQYLQITRPTYERQKLPLYGANVPRPSAVAQFFSFGQQARDWAARASQYDLQAQVHNNALDEKATLQALRLMQADQEMQLAQRKMAVTEADVGTQKLNDQLNAIIKMFNIQRMQANDPSAPPIVPEPSTSGQPPSAAPATSGFAPPAPGSPLAGGGPAAPAAPAAADPTKPRPGENMWAFQQRRKAEIAAAAKGQQATSTTRTMQEAVPKIHDLVRQVRDDLTRVKPGPLASRYKEFMTGTVGVADPAWTAYRTNVGLLTTLLLRMHVGARGGQHMMEHFRNLLNQGRQSPENMEAALQQIEEYANSVGGEHSDTSTTTTTTPSSTTTTTTQPAASTIEDILSKHGY